MIVTVHHGPAPEPTREELLAQLARYRSRLPAQHGRVATAAVALQLASPAEKSACEAEHQAAVAALDRLNGIITDLASQIKES